MKISEFHIGAEFQRFCSLLLTAEFTDFQAIDGSGGDAGNDGHIASKKMLFAMYCPAKQPTLQRHKKKVIEDLDKAVKLRDEDGYDIEFWTFVIPSDPSEKLSSYIRQEAADRGFKGLCWGETQLHERLMRHPQIKEAFPDLNYPEIESQIQELGKKIDSLIDTQKSSTPKEEAKTEPALPALHQPTARLIEAERLIYSGQKEEGLQELYRIKAKPVNDYERLWSLVILAQNQDALDFAKVAAFCNEGIALAETIDDPEANALLKIELAFGLNFQWLEIDHQGYAENRMGNLAGVDTWSENAKKEIIAKLDALAAERNALIHESLEIARDKKLYRTLCWIYDRMGHAAGLRYIHYKSIVNMGTTALCDMPPAEETLCRNCFEGSLRIARVLGGAEAAGTIILNYCQQLILFEDWTYATVLLEEAKELFKDDPSKLADVESLNEKVVGKMSPFNRKG